MNESTYCKVVTSPCLLSRVSRQKPPVQPLQCQNLQDVSSFCEESRCRNQWVPCLQLQDR